MAARRAGDGARIRLIRLTLDGTVDLDDYRRLLSPRTRVVAVAHASNVLGTISDLGTISEMAHKVGAIVVADGAQPHAHLEERRVGEPGTDAQALGQELPQAARGWSRVEADIFDRGAERHAMVGPRHHVVAEDRL